MREKDRFIPAIVVALMVAIAPHAARLPIWIVIWCGVIWTFVLYAVKAGQAMPGPVLRVLLTIGGFAAGMATYNFSFDMNAGVGLLSIMVGLKPLETRTHRDRMMTVFLTYFLVITTLFYTNELIMTVYLACSVLVTTAVLIRINHTAAPLKRAFGTSAKIMVQAIPLMVVLFVFFPRIQGILWGSAKQNFGTTGFSDHLEPGNMSRLARSDAIAFRAEFTGRIPPPDRLYWRGLVFQHYNGLRWSQGEPASGYVNIVSGGDPVETIITLEPHGEKWLFALDLPKRAQWPARFRADHTLTSHRPLHARIRYRVTSDTTYHTGGLLPWERATLELPARGNPQSRVLAEKWLAAHGEPEKIIQAALAFFRENEFYYTLNAPMLDKNAIDDFVFRTRKGYCEHYASAFVFLMRAANIPSRIIGGYLGGEINPYGNYMIVRQSDAHAWTEVWLRDKGWVRVDPTSAVAPERIEQGPAAALAPDERLTLESYSDLDLGPLTGYVKKITLGWDRINSQWNGWVLGYSYFRQQALFSKIGMPSGSLKGPVAATLGVAVLAVLSGFVFSVWIRRRNSGKNDAVQNAYRRYCAKLAKVGLSKPPCLGPVQYARDVVAARPDLAEMVRQITDRYILIRYAGKGDEKMKRVFVGDVNRFRPKKRQ